MVPNSKEHRFPAVYLFTNKRNGKIYVGSAKDLYERYDEYTKYVDGKKSKRPIEHAIKKYGLDSFTFETLERVDNLENLLAREQYYIDTLAVCDREIGYNVNKTAGSRLGMRHTEESRKKMSIALTGKRHTEESRCKMSVNRKGHKKSDEWRQNIATALNRPERVKDFIEKVSKPVCQIDSKTLTVLQVFPSIKIAQLAMGKAGKTNIGSVCKKRSHSAYGFYWRFKEEYDSHGFVAREWHALRVEGPPIRKDK